MGGRAWGELSGVGVELVGVWRFDRVDHRLFGDAVPGLRGRLQESRRGDGEHTDHHRPHHHDHDDVKPTTTTTASTTTTTTTVKPTTTTTTTTTTAAPTTTTTHPTTTTVAPVPPPQGPASTTVALDGVVNAQVGLGGSLVSPSLSTSRSGELLVAFVSTDGPGQAGTQAISGVSGGGLRWTRAVVSNAQPGASEIWTAFSSQRVRRMRVTATRTLEGYEGSITVAAFRGRPARSARCRLCRGTRVRPHCR